LVDRKSEHSNRGCIILRYNRFGIAYVDVGDQQAVAIEQVDFIFQGRDASGNPELIKDALTADTSFGVQLFDLNPGGVLRFADDNSLIASADYNWDQNGIASSASDFFPDTFGKLDEARMVVNDHMYLQAISSGTYGAGESVDVTARIKARIVKLSTKDWIAIAVQSTAADN